MAFLRSLIFLKSGLMLSRISLLMSRSVSMQFSCKLSFSPSSLTTFLQQLKLFQISEWSRLMFWMYYLKRKMLCLVLGPIFQSFRTLVSRQSQSNSMIRLTMVNHNQFSIFLQDQLILDISHQYNHQISKLSPKYLIFLALNPTTSLSYLGLIPFNNRKQIHKEIQNMAIPTNTPLYIAALLFCTALINNLSNNTPADLATPTNTLADIPQWTEEPISLEEVKEFVDGAVVELPPYLYRPEQLAVLVVALEDGQTVDYPLQNFQQEPSFQLPNLKQQITSLVLKRRPAQQQSDPLVKASTQRLLTYSTDYSILNTALLVFQSVLQMSRYLLLVGLLSNSIDVFLPFILFSECFLMLGFLNCDMFTLKDFYYNVFNSKVDILNAIRLGMSPGADDSTITVLAQYNFSSVIFYNLAGEFLFVIVFLAITIFLKVASIFMNSEKIRAAKGVLRGLWNGCFMALLPRVATFTGFHFRMISGAADIVNILVCGLLCLIYVIFFIQLLLHTRKINSKLEYIEGSRFDLGLASRIDHRQQFEFDCLNYSMLYYPLMNYFRLLLFFVPIGASYDMHYMGFGGPLFSQLLMMMIEISSPGYLLKRDKIMYPICNFFILLMELSVVSVGLAESVEHSQVSLLAMSVLFCLATLLFGALAVAMVLDFRLMVSRRCSEKGKEEELEEDEVTQKIVRGEPVKMSKMAKKTEMSEQIKDDCSDIDDYCITAMSKKTTKNPQLKIKKVRRGRII